MSWSEVTAYWDLPDGLDWTPTSEITDFEASNLIDGLDTTWWRATSSADQELIFDNGASLISEFLTSVFDASAASPQGITHDPNGTLWICDWGTDKIYNVEKDGTLISEFLTSVFDASATSPGGITYDTNGTLWISDTVTDKIYNVEKDGTWISEFPLSTFDASAASSGDIAFDTNGTLWISDVVTDKIYNVEKDGTWISEFPLSTFDASAENPTGITHDPNGTLWICDDTTDKVYNVEKDGTWISEFPVSVIKPGFTSPRSLGYDPDGSLWVTDHFSFGNIYNVKIPPSFNYLAIGAGHNLNSIGADVELYFSDDAAAYTQIDYTYTPKDDKTFVLLTSSTLTHRAIKVKIINASAAANITSCLVGKKTTLDFANLYDPHKKKGSRIINLTEGGRLAGASNKSTLRDVQLKFRNASPILYNKLDDIWQNNGLRMFFISWEPTGHPLEVWPVFVDDENRNAPFVVSGILRNDGIKLKGLYE